MSEYRFPIVFAIDEGYVAHLATAIGSLLHNNQDVKLRIIVLTSQILEEDKESLKNYALKNDVPLDFYFLEDKFFDGLVLNHHFKKSNYYRLFAADAIQDETCLYLDADIIVNGSILELTTMNIDDYYLAAVEEYGVFHRHAELGMSSDSKYFNSGVMLINLNKWRKDKIKDAVISFVRKRSAYIQFVDQCGLNGVVDGRWFELEANFNFQTSQLNHGKVKNSLPNKNPAVIHFTGSSKPWQMNDKHPYRHLYWKYRSGTPYSSLVSDDYTLFNLLRYITPEPIKKLIKSLIGNREK